jgi:hypothetical protein
MSRPACRSLLIPVFLAAAAMGATFAGEEPKVEKAFTLPSPTVPEGLGVNIHFTDARRGEMKMLAEAGFGIIRMDFGWGGTERKKGEYDFKPYERLLAALEPHGIRALFILDYSNKLYDQGLSPCSDVGRQAFARWSAAAVRHFKGRGILWEMYNEPNIGFWKPKPNPPDFVKLALAVGQALREAEPEEIYIGPATSEIDLSFLEECFKGGLLEYWRAVSVHPYRQSNPETVAEEYRRLRALIRKYAPKGKEIPILSGEWGYSVTWGNHSEEKQGKRLPRQWLTNLANDVNVSIWYDWHDDGTDAKDPECHFGTVKFPYFKDRDPVYDPKPSYLAAKTLTTALKGFRFNKRLAVGGADDYVFLFSKGDETRLAVWSVLEVMKILDVPASPGTFMGMTHLGEVGRPLVADAKGLAVMPTDGPLYLVPDKPNDMLRVAAAWEGAPLEYWLRAGPEKNVVTLRLKNPLDKELKIAANAATKGGTVKPGEELLWTAEVKLGRADESLPLRFECELEGGAKLVQESRACVANPLRLTVLPLKAGALSVRVENPSGEAFRGTLALTDIEGLTIQEPRQALAFKEGEREQTASFSCAAGEVAAYRLGAQLLDEKGAVEVAFPAVRTVYLSGFPRGGAESDYRVVPDGDGKVASEQALTAAAPPGDLPLPGAGVLKLAYRFDPGWKFVRVVPAKDELKAIEGKPKSLCLWVHGDGMNLSPRMRFVDATGQCFQPAAPNVSFKGWRPLIFPLDGSHSGHWGGANDGVVHYPIKLDTLFLLDNGSKEKVQGEVYLQGAAWVW